MTEVINKEEENQKLEKIWEDATTMWGECIKSIYKSLSKLEDDVRKFKAEYGVDIGIKEKTTAEPSLAESLNK